MARDDAAAEKNVKLTKGAEKEKEPEGGPRQREIEFLEERTQEIRPKGKGPYKPAPPAKPLAPADAADEEGVGDKSDDQEVIEDRVGKDFRRRLVSEYRERQRRGLKDSGPKPPGH